MFNILGKFDFCIRITVHKSDAPDANCTWFLLKNIVECDIMSPDICANRISSENRQANLNPIPDERIVFVQ